MHAIIFYMCGCTVEFGLSDDICSPYMCQIKQKLDKSGKTVYKLVMGIHNKHWITEVSGCLIHVQYINVCTYICMHV